MKAWLDFFQKSIVHNYLIDPAAQLELEEAGEIYISYFTELGEPSRGLELSEAFVYDYIDKIQQLKKTPFMYPLCSVYPFDADNPNGYRSFRVGWFTVFYTVENGSVIVWHIRSSKSDFSVIR